MGYSQQEQLSQDPYTYQGFIQHPTQHEQLPQPQQQEQFIPKISEQEQDVAQYMMLYLKASVHGLLATIHNLRTENQNLRKENLTLKFVNEALTQDCRTLKNQLLLLTSGQLPMEPSQIDHFHLQQLSQIDLLSLENQLAFSGVLNIDNKKQSSNDLTWHSSVPHQDSGAGTMRTFTGYGGFAGLGDTGLLQGGEGSREGLHVLHEGGEG